MRMQWTVLAAVMATGLAACGGGEPPAATDDPAMTPEAAAPAAAPAVVGALPEGVSAEVVAQGKEIFHTNGICFTCHGADGAGGMLAPAFTDDVWINIDGEYTSIVELVKVGVPTPVEHPGMMPARAGVNLSDEQVEAVAAYVYSLSHAE